MTNSPKRSKVLHILLWITQVILAALFAMSGFMKSFTPIEELAKMMAWVNHVPVAAVRLAAVSELLAALGLLLPSLLRIMPKLTGFAALGLVLVMLLAGGLHASLGEYSGIAMNAFLMLLAGFVAWGRLVKAPIRPRGK